MTGQNDGTESQKTIGGRAINMVESAGSKVEDVVEGVIGEDHLVVRKTKRAWQTFLLYPAVFGALLGAIPTGIDLYKSFKYGIEYSSVAHAEKQLDLWKKNLHCVTGLTYHTVKTDDGSTIQIGACKNGDVLIELIPEDDRKSVSEWVSLNRADGASAVGSLLISKAFAAGGAASVVANGGKVQTMCTKLNASNRTIERITKQRGKCTREVTNLITRKSISRKTVSCSSKCSSS